MVWDERHYNKAGQGGGGMPGRLQGGSVVMWLLGINAVVFVLDMILGGGSRVGRRFFYEWGNFNITQGVEGLQVWRLVGYQFIHADFFHILFNMIGLYFFGPLMEQWWGSKRFIAFYLLCGVAGALPMIALVYIGVIPPQVGLVGASGALYGILIGAAVLFPHQKVQLLIPPIPMTLRTMALVFLGISALSVIVGNNDGGNAAHLAGAAVGFALVKTPGLLNWADRLSAQAIQDGINEGRHERKVKQVQASREEVDRILEKVSEQGLHSLSKKEKKILQQDTNRLRKD